MKWRKVQNSAEEEENWRFGKRRNVKMKEMGVCLSESELSTTTAATATTPRRLALVLSLLFLSLLEL